MTHLIHIFVGLEGLMGPLVGSSTMKNNKNVIKLIVV